MIAPFEKFLRSQHPFHTLDADETGRVQSKAKAATYAPGEKILHQGGPTSEYLHVLAEGHVRLERDGMEIQVLEEGDCFGYPSIISQSSPTVSVIAEDRVTVYLIPAEVFTGLLTNSRFAEFFLKDLSERLQLRSGRGEPALGGTLTTALADLDMRPVVRVPQDATVAEAARAMRAAREDVVLVGDLNPGIVTDHDFQVKVLAENLGPETPADTIASRPMKTLPPDTALHTALLYMLENRIHHLPVVEGDTIQGIISATDMLRHQSRNPLYLMTRLDHLEDRAGLVSYSRDAAAMVERLFDGGLKVAQIGRIFASLNDVLVRSLCRLAEQDLGPAPCSYAWLVFGSEGRMEQALLTDQDNALAYADDTPEAAEYFARFAELVVGDLIAAGFPPCPGGCMATNWNKALARWEKTVEGWIRTPTPDNLMVTSIFFDFRAVAGDLSMETVDSLIESARENQLFMAHLARVSLRFKPPLGLFRRIQTADGKVDVKKRGIASVVAAARVYGLETGTRARPTRERIEAAMEAGNLGQDLGQNIIESYRFLLQIRLQEQLERIRVGEEPVNDVRLSQLSSLEQRHLKDAFQAIRELQSAVTQRFGTNALG